MKKAVVIAPFWGQEGHIGCVRIERLVRSLVKGGYFVVVVKAGAADDLKATAFGQEVTVRDSFGLYREPSKESNRPTRKPNKLRRALAYWIFNPDPTIVWSRLVARHPVVLESAAHTAFILSSNPPESAHVGASILASKLGVPHIVDMRDGWLDEPLKPILRSSALRRWQESFQEKRVMQSAAAIMVTTPRWRALLCERLDGISPKVTVLSNGYPEHSSIDLSRSSDGVANSRIQLVHAGRFLGSDPRRSPELLLEPLLSALSEVKSQGDIKLIGSLSEEEGLVVSEFKHQMDRLGWRLECPGSMDRDVLLQLLQRADGLLLLTVTSAQVPGKLFEYIPTGRPILVACNRDSATWNLCKELPQAFLVDLESTGDQKNAVINFLNAAAMTATPYSIPCEFAEAELSRVFLDVVDSVVEIKR